MPAETEKSPDRQNPEKSSKVLDQHQLQELARQVFELLKKEGQLEKERRGWKGGSRESD